MRASQEHSHISAVNVRPLQGFNSEDYRQLAAMGIQLPDRQLAAMIEGIGMDALTSTLTTASIPTPVQFLQNWLPGFVKIITAARKIDELIGITTSGSWEDEEIVQGLLEELGGAVPYSDTGNVPLANWNVNFNTRTVVRFEQGMRVGTLEEARASRISINTADMKRSAATLALEIERNSIGFNGYNSGDNNTYGFLNDPGLPNYVIFPNGATNASPSWATKTYVDITNDIITMAAALRLASQDNIDPKSVATTLGLATAIVDQLSKVNTLGSQSVEQWIKATYPKMRVVSAPELDSAHSSDNVAYLYADTVSDTSTDDGRVWLQCVPAKFRVLGVQTLAKGYEEDYTNATAGVMVKRPYAIVRYYGC